MQFTPQQLAGGPKFSPVTRIGNWQEDLAMEEAKIGSFQQRSATGSLSLHRLERKMAVCSEIVPHSYSPNGFLSFKDTIILQHEVSGSVLACDPFESVSLGRNNGDTCLVTTIAEHPIPKARNVFRVVRPPRHLQDPLDNDQDPIVRIGQPFLLQCHEALLVQPNSSLLAPALYLSSTRKSERTATKRTNRQMVFMSSILDSDCVWYTQVPSKGKANGNERFLALGAPLSISSCYQITHRQTNMFLTCDPAMRTMTEHGCELECYADRSTSYGKISLMVSEFKGLSTSQTLTKPDAPTFSWRVLTNTQANESDQDKDQDRGKIATSETVLIQAREFIQTRGLDAFWNLRAYLRELERRLPVEGKLDCEDVKEALGRWGLASILSGNYLGMLLDLVDRDRMGLVDSKDLMHLLRGPLSPYRHALLQRVFASLDEAGEGSVSIARLQKSFQGADHPLVSLGGFTEAQALEHMLKSFEMGRRTATRVSFEMFADYYGDLSAAVEDDAYFEAIVRSNWP